MANVIQGGEEVFNSLVYGQAHPNTLRFLQAQIADFGQTLTEAGQQFFSGIQTIFDRFHGSEAMRLGKQAQRKVSGLFELDIIRPLWELSEIQNATPVNQRFIMAIPEVRELFHQQLCHGFAETYVDMFPQDIGRTHYDYRRINNGFVEETEDGDAKITYYYDEPYEGEFEPTLNDRVDFRTTRDAVLYHLRKRKSDPTDPQNGSLQ